MINPVNVSEQDSRAMRFIKNDNIQAGQNISNAGAIGGMAADIGLSLLSVIPVGGAAVGTAKEGVEIAKEGVEVAKEGVKVAKAAGEGLSAAKETLKASKGALGTARQGVQAAKAATPAFKTASKTLQYTKVGAGLAGNYGQYKSAVASGDTTGAVKAGLGAGGSVANTTISEVK